MPLQLLGLLNLYIIRQRESIPFFVLRRELNRPCSSNHFFLDTYLDFCYALVPHKMKNHQITNQQTSELSTATSSPYTLSKRPWRFYAALIRLCVINLVCAIDATSLSPWLCREELCLSSLAGCLILTYI